MVSAFEGVLEGSGIGGGGVGAPAEGLLVRVEIEVEVGQGGAEVVEELAEIGAGLGFVGVGPEEEGELLAADGGAGVEDEVGDERLQAGGADAGDDLASAKDPESTQELDVQRHGLSMMHQERRAADATAALCPAGQPRSPILLPNGKL
jgi:hypothetical protein